MPTELQNHEIAAQKAAEAQQGDRSAFEWLVRRYRNLVASIAYSHIGDFDRSEDIAQLTFLTAWERLAALQDSETVVGWLAGIARNLARNEARRAHHKSEVSADAHEEQVLPKEDRNSEPPEAIAMRKEQQELLWNMLEKLPINYREPLVLFYREGNSVSEVALQLELSSSTVKQRLSRGRNLLRAELMGALEETLRETEPNEEFVGSVMSSLPVSTLLAAGGSATVTKGVQFLFFKKLFGGAAVTGALGGILGGLLGAFGGVLGAWWGTKQSLKSATSNQEKVAIKRFGVQITVLALAFGVIQMLTLLSMGRSYLWISIASSTVAYTVLLITLILRFNKQIAKIKSEYGTDDERVSGGYAQPVIKPASLKASRFNNIGSFAGSSIWLVLLAGLNHDYVAAGMMLVVVAVLCGTAWNTLGKANTASEQFRINTKLILPLFLSQALLVGFRWNNWPLLSFGTGLVYEGWLLSAAILALGLILYAVMQASARNLARREQAQKDRAIG